MVDISGSSFKKRVLYCLHHCTYSWFTVNVNFVFAGRQSRGAVVSLKNFNCLCLGGL